MQSMRSAELKYFPTKQGRALSAHADKGSAGAAVGKWLRQALVFGLLVMAMLFLPLMRGAGASAEETDGLFIEEVLQLNALVAAEVMDFIHRD